MKLPWSRPQVAEENLAGRMAVLAAATVANGALGIVAGLPFTAIACLAGVAGGHWWSWRGRHRPRTFGGRALLAGLILACTLYLVLDLTLSLFGGALPQAKFAVLVQAVTSFDLKTRRNLFTHLWHSLVVLYVAALFAWTVAFLPLVLLWAGCMWAFLAFTREPGSATRSTEPAAVGGRLASWIRTTTRQRGGIVRWGVAWMLLSALVFVVLPRFAGRPVAVPFMVSVPLRSDLPSEVLPAVLPLVQTSTDGSEGGAINLRVRGRLGDEVVLQVRAPAPSYWRGYVLERYDGQSWQARPRPFSAPGIALHIPIRGENTAAGPSLPQTFYVRKPLGSQVPVAYPLRELYFPARYLVMFDSGTVQSPAALRRGVTYAAVSQVRDLSPAALRGADSIDPQANRAYLDLPGGLPARVRELADRLAADEPTEYDQVRAIADYLRSHYRYSLDTPRLPSGADAVDQFLFVDHVGYCEQFASALAVLLRLEGIPSRVAVGYATGDHNTLAGTFTVRARDAHAWVEILFPGIGWVPVDASPGFDPEPASRRPSHWFLSDLNTHITILGSAPLGGARSGLAAAALAGLVFALFALLRRPRPARLPADVRTYMAAQRWLRAGGLPVRLSTQTPTEHLVAVFTASRAVGAALEPLARRVELAVFGRPVRKRRVGLGRLVAAVVQFRVLRRPG
jgi:transglutaminase-like putative cysteine protease